MMQRKIMDLAERYLEEVTNLRRELHKIPLHHFYPFRSIPLLYNQNKGKTNIRPMKKIEKENYSGAHSWKSTNFYLFH